MTAFAAWSALGLVLLLWAALVVLVVMGRRLWGRVGSTVQPMLQMFAPPAPETPQQESDRKHGGHFVTVPEPIDPLLCSTCGHHLNLHAQPKTEHGYVCYRQPVGSCKCTAFAS